MVALVLHSTLYLANVSSSMLWLRWLMIQRERTPPPHLCEHVVHSDQVVHSQASPIFFSSEIEVARVMRDGREVGVGIKLGFSIQSCQLSQGDELDGVLQSSSLQAVISLAFPSQTLPPYSLWTITERLRVLLPIPQAAEHWNFKFENFKLSDEVT